MAYTHPELLVTVEWLVAHRTDPDLVIVDMRPAEDYAGGHIPGAINLELGEILTEIDGVRAQLIPLEMLAVVLGSRGITAQTTIIAYDGINGMYAGRLFWTLEYYCHADVRLLDGHLEAWIAAGHASSTETPAVQPVTYVVGGTQPAIRVGGEYVLKRLNDSTMHLLDVRTLNEFTGVSFQEDHGGRIPGAVHIFWKLNHQSDGLLKPQPDLEALYQPFQAADAHIVLYCQVGYRAAFVYFVMRLIGLENMTVYDGSWAEWGNRTDWPYLMGAPRPPET